MRCFNTSTTYSRGMEDRGIEGDLRVAWWEGHKKCGVILHQARLDSGFYSTVKIPQISPEEN